ncbi:TPA: hypothetical protein RXP60_003258 [Escherichia coli]|nr:hypothetical protein [Escherichia coli]HDX3848504.1 hypothetical protein [Escherichia coli]HEA8547782.1 hypothetical protein [Escherichia coli]
MTEADMLEMIRSIAGIRPPAGKHEATQPDTVTAENYARVVADVMRRDGIELNGVDMRDIRTRVLELLAYRRRSQQRRESAKNTYQWKKPERLRR